MSVKLKIPNNHFCKKYGINEMEYKIISMISQGLTHAEISKIIHRSYGTTQNYSKSLIYKMRLFGRLPVKNITHAVSIFIQDEVLYNKEFYMELVNNKEDSAKEDNNDEEI